VPKLKSPLPLGYSAVAPAQLASVVTCLEMTRKPQAAAPRGFPPSHKLVPFERPDVSSYRALFRKVGEDWLWSSRLTMPEEALQSLLNDPQVEVFTLREGDKAVGLVELDFREAGECELAFFGLMPEAIGRGLGRSMMEAALALAWARPIGRLWLHTCTFDHPSAPVFYIRSGFRPYALQIEVLPDPRLTGHLPRTAAPHIPVIEG
jgi:GNAT superfamily N-acetyltransferase